MRLYVKFNAIESFISLWKEEGEAPHRRRPACRRARVPLHCGARHLSLLWGGSHF